MLEMTHAELKENYIEYLEVLIEEIEGEIKYLDVRLNQNRWLLEKIRKEEALNN